MKASTSNLGAIERTLSGLVSAFLFHKAASLTGWARLPLALLGGVAAQRALSGHSEVYEKLGISSAEGVQRFLHPALPEPPSLPLVLSVEVGKPRDEVFARLLALPGEALPKEEVLAIHREESRVRLWLDEGGAMKEYDLSLVREIPGRELALRARPSDRIPAAEIRLSDSSAQPGATTVTVQLERKQSWLKNIGTAIGVDHDHKVAAKYLIYLKALLEEGAIEAQGSAHVDDGLPANRDADYH